MPGIATSKLPQNRAVLLVYCLIPNCFQGSSLGSFIVRLPTLSYGRHFFPKAVIPNRQRTREKVCGLEKGRSHAELQKDTEKVKSGDVGNCRS